jgi:hypothetical protein
MTAKHSHFRSLLAAALIATLVVPTPLAMAATAPLTTGKDVRLEDGGRLITRIVDAQGKPVANAEVLVQFRGRSVARTLSDENGYARFSGLRSGAHTIVSPASEKQVRLWTAATAPPDARDISVVVSDLTVMRGQFGGFNLPMAVYGAATVTALVLAVNAGNDADDANAAVKQALQQIAELEDRLEEHENASP